MPFRSRCSAIECVSCLATFSLVDRRDRIIGKIGAALSCIRAAPDDSNSLAVKRYKFYVERISCTISLDHVADVTNSKFPFSNIECENDTIVFINCAHYIFSLTAAFSRRRLCAFSRGLASCLREVHSLCACRPCSCEVHEFSNRDAARHHDVFDAQMRKRICHT